MIQDSQHKFVDIFRKRVSPTNQFHYEIVRKNDEIDTFIPKSDQEYALIDLCSFFDKCPSILVTGAGYLLRCSSSKHKWEVKI